MNELLTPQQRRAIETAVERCGSCRQLADMAKLLGRDDPDFRDMIDHLEGAGRSALELHHQVKNGASGT